MMYSLKWRPRNSVGRLSHIRFNVSDPTSILFATLPDALANDYGSGTPDAEFLTAILAMYGIKLMSPERVEVIAKQYRENFESAVRDAQHLFQRHPELREEEHAGQATT